MEEKRKDLMAAGLYLGDVTLVLAAVTRDLPSYVRGFEVDRIIPDAAELEPARREVESLVAGRDSVDEVPPELIKKICDTAIEKGKFHSASRCLSILGERDAYVEKYVKSAREKVRARDFRGAARDIAVASNLETDTGFPLFQYTGPELHAGCTTAPENCLTRAPAEDAVRRATAYLLGGEKVLAFAGDLGADETGSLFPYLALERDPGLRDFYAAFAGAHKALGEMETGELASLRADMSRAAEVTAELAGSLSAAAAPDGSSGPALERAKRLAGGFGKDFEGIDSLIDDFQLRRVKRRIGSLLDSEDELRAAREALTQGGSGDTGALDSAIALVQDFRGRGILERVDQIEAGLIGLQVGLLGRPVHSQEHWQYLRELAFKNPVSPVMCCIRKLNDRYMVVPMWESEVAGLLREFMGKGGKDSA